MNKVLDSTGDSNSHMESLIASASSSNGALVSDIEREDTLHCSRLEDE